MLRFEAIRDAESILQKESARRGPGVDGLPWTEGREGQGESESAGRLGVLPDNQQQAKEETEESPVKFSISILTYTALPQAKRCIESVLKHTKDFELILTANGNERVADYFVDLSTRFANIVVLHNKENKGFWQPNNTAFAIARGEFFICLNDDTVVPEGWTDALIQPFLKDPKAALCCPSGGCSALRPDFHGMVGAFEYCEGACLMVRSSIAREHGLFDSNLPAPAYGEDSNLSLRYRELGYSIHHVPLALQHMRAVTSRTIPQVKDWQDKNHAYNRARFRQYMKVRRMDYPILVRRNGARGDVLLITPVLRQIRKERPLSPLFVETQCPDVLAGFPGVTVGQHVPVKYQTAVLDLNMAYENRRNTSILTAYFDEAKRILNIEGTNEDTWIGGERPLLKSGIVFHAGPTNWVSKNWPADRFAALAMNIMDAGHSVILVGHGAIGERIPCTFDYRGKLTVQQTATTIAGAKLFVGVDSFPLHVAQAVGTPAIGLFGVTDSRYIMLPSKPGRGIDAKVPTHGLRHREIGKTFVNDNGAAIQSIQVEEVWQAVKEFLT